MAALQFAPLPHRHLPVQSTIPDHPDTRASMQWEDRNFEHEWRSMLRKLETVYRHAYPDETSFPGVYGKIFLERPEPDHYARDCFASNPVGMVDIVLVSSMYSARALWEYLNKQEQLAWSFLMDAQYHAGAAWYAMVLDAAMPAFEEQAALNAIKEMQREGGRARNAPWLDVENYAVELVRARASQGDTWTSERKMAAAIKKDLMEFAGKNGLDISEKRYVQTISDRLKRRREDISPYLSRKKEKK